MNLRTYVFMYIADHSNFVLSKYVLYLFSLNIIISSRTLKNFYTIFNFKNSIHTYVNTYAAVTI